VQNLRKRISNLNKTLPLLSISILILLGIATTPISHSDPSPTPLVYIDTPTITGTTGTFNITILAKDFTNLYTWQAGLSWNSTVLNATNLYAYAALTDDVFDVLAPGRYTLWQAGTIDNTTGRLSLSAQALTGTAPGVNGVSGVSYKLMKVEFKFKVSGTSDFHLTDAMLVDVPPTANQMPIQIIDYFTAFWGGTGYPVVILTNSTGTSTTKLHSHTFNPDLKQLSFNITSRAQRKFGGVYVNTIGFSDITIPKNFMWVDALTEWSVTVNGAPPLALDKEVNATHYHVYFTYNHINGELQIKITSKYAVPEFPAILLPALLMILTLLATILGTRIYSMKKQRSHPCQTKRGSQQSTEIT